jgi:hypothetical protein
MNKFKIDANPIGINGDLEAYCPGCNYSITFEKRYFIDANVESEGKIFLDEPIFVLRKKCVNPLCEWSRI